MFEVRSHCRGGQASPRPPSSSRSQPSYRLPREILDAEIDRIADRGVTLGLGAKVTDVLEAMHDEGFDAVFLAVGAPLGKRAYVPAGKAARILDAVTVLHSMDVARTARRSSAGSTRRPRSSRRGAASPATTASTAISECPCGAIEMVPETI